MEKRRIGFIIFLIVGNVVVGLSTFHYLGKDATIEFIAIFTSLSTAAYSILNEPEKPQPLLRIQLTARGGYAMAQLGLDLLIDNIGDANAKDIKVVCKTSPDAIALEGNGIYKIKPISPRERHKVNLVTSIESGKISTQRIDVEVTYSNMENKKQASINESYEMKDLIKKMEDDILTRRKSVF
jgi:hypothetical protein